MSRNGIRTALIPAVVVALGIPLSLSGQEDTLRYEVGRALPPTVEGRPLVPMTLEEAIARALELNLDIQTARLSPQIQEYSLSAAESVFDPTLGATLGYNNSTNLPTSQLDGGAQVTNQRSTYNASISKLFPWYGGRLSANFNNGRTETDNTFTTRNPSYSSTLSFNYTQPLLSGFKTDNQRTALKTQEIQGEITDLQLVNRVESIKYQVYAAYWGLRATIEQIEIQRQSLALAQELLAQNRIRVSLGTMSELQVVQAEAQVASAEQALLNAEVQWRNQELGFKSLLVGGADDPLFQQTVNPVDLPTIEGGDVDIQAAIDTALEQRTDLRQQRRQRQISVLDLSVVENNVLPSLNLTAGYSLQGVGGDLYSRSELGGDPILIEEGGYKDGLKSLWNRDAPTWNFSLNFSYPIGNFGAKANRERARLQLQQTDLALRNQELSVVTQVTNAGLAVNDGFLQVQAAQRSREVAERNAQIELTRFRVGAATNYEVTQAQNDLTLSRLSELRALLNYVNAIAEFDLVQRVGG
ncbi:MAG: TolC family protein [Gemmatimonadota bacterium]